MLPQAKRKEFKSEHLSINIKANNFGWWIAFVCNGTGYGGYSLKNVNAIHSISWYKNATQFTRFPKMSEVMHKSSWNKKYNPSFKQEVMTSCLIHLSQKLMAQSWERYSSKKTRMQWNRRIKETPKSDTWKSYSAHTYTVLYSHPRAVEFE